MTITFPESGFSKVVNVKLLTCLATYMSTIAEA